MPRRIVEVVLASFVCGVMLAPNALAGIESWSVADQRGGMPRALALAGSRAFAGISTGGLGGGLLASNDAGVTWRRVPSFGYRDVQGIAIDPNPGQPAYAATRTGVVRSLDGGTTWAEIAGAGSAGQSYRAVAVRPSA
jgi:photosystem II stability/assembly factor-like uncharacterized protein